MTPHEQLQAIQERADAVTPGPWSADQFVVREMTQGYLWTVASAANANVAVAEFIAHARTDIPRLMAALRAVLDLAGAADAAADQVMAHGVPAGRVSTIELRRAITEALS